MIQLGLVPASREVSDMITVKLKSFDFGGASRPEGLDGKDPHRPLEVEVEPGTNLEGLFKLGNPRDNSIMAFVNGQQQGLDYRLQQDDMLDFLTPMGGG